MMDNRGSSTYQASSNQWKNRLASAAHHLGTLRMSEDANTGCVDRNLKLHGFQDIFVYLWIGFIQHLEMQIQP